VIPKWAWAAVRRGDAGWIEDGCLIASSNADPLYMHTDWYTCRWADVRFPRDATALWAPDQPPAPAVAGPAIADATPSKRQRPLDEDLDRQMSEHVQLGSKYESTINDRRTAKSEETNDHVKKKKARRDEKRPEIAGAIAALADLTEWQDSSDKKRCRLVERYLRKPEGWCSSRTLGRAVAERAK
jgi:hypothetical protein